MKILTWALIGALVSQAAELPVKRVTLYKHGVGYFERAGELAPGESARLDFQASQMNDVLKSLTLEIRGGTGVAGLRYDSAEPLSKKLENIPINLGDRQPLTTLLDQLKGARLELRLGATTVAGAIVGARIVPATNNTPEKEQVTLLTDAGELQTVDLSAASSIKFPDPRLQQQLADYLTAVTQARSQETRSVYIDSIDSARRNIVASYMTPMPVWKSSYRLIVPETGEATLEGWAIVDNTTGEDWNNVDLALVSGRPISFISRLYEPRYVDRPLAELPEDQAQAPVLYAGAVGGFMERDEAAAKQEGRFAAMAAPRAAPPPAPAAEALRDQATSTLANTAQGRELGELFEYRFGKPITVRKSESAMLPFLQQKLNARKLTIYSDESSQHPLNAAELTNSTGKTLDGGPITVYESNTYAGEALMETTKAGDERLISYGVDLGTRVTTQFDSRQAVVREVHVRRGVLTARSAMQETKTYTIRNVDAKAKTLVIEHPARPGYNLLSPQPSERTANAYRFEVKLPPSADQKFVVTEERLFDQTYAVSSLTPQFLTTIVQNKDLSAAARKQLEAIAALKNNIASNDTEIHNVEQQVQEMTQDQQRIRQNIESLNRVAGQQTQVQNYARQLADQESRLVTMRDQLSELRKNKTALEAQLGTMIEQLDF